MSDTEQEKRKKRRRRSSGKVKAAAKATAQAEAATHTDKVRAGAGLQADDWEDRGKGECGERPPKRSRRSPGIGAVDGISPMPKERKSVEAGNAVEGGASTSETPRTAHLDATAAFAATEKPYKPSAKAKLGQGRKHTVSVAVPGSVVLNAQTWELKTALVGQIARACGIYGVDEIIVFDEPKQALEASQPPRGGVLRGKYRKVPDAHEGSGHDRVGGAESGRREGEGEAEGEEEEFDPGKFMARILEYLECPQYLRKSLFPLHPDLRLAGLLPPLDLPHHLRREDDSPWREGCIIPPDQALQYASSSLRSTKAKGKGKARTVWADVGLHEPVEVRLDGVAPSAVPPWTRVTVEMPSAEGKPPALISPRTPSEEKGVYWGYAVRRAECISKVFTEGPWSAEGGYDLTIGTSERGHDVAKAIEKVESFRHLLLVLGGLSGLELIIAADKLIDPPLPADEAWLLFDKWVNVLPGQGSRTVRTEEALVVSLGALRDLCLRAGIKS